MSRTEAAQLESWIREPMSADSRTSSLHRLPVYLACTALALAADYLLGKDMAWDTLNYHLYAGFSAVNDRFGQDYFAAGPQSYLNPYAYAPFYGMVRAGLTAFEISGVLAIVHSSILWLTYELAVSLFQTDEVGLRVWVGTCAVAMAFANPILLQQIGTSFADITTAIFVLAAWVLLVRAYRAPRRLTFVVAGLLLGMASAFKLTNAVHSISAVALLILLPVSGRRRLSSTLWFSAAATIGFAGVAAPWAIHLERMFGNPFFPLMNSVFRSPYFTTERLLHYRFIPDSVAEALWRPFAIVNPVRMVQEELRSPDVRYALLVVLLALLILRILGRRRESLADSPRLPDHMDTRALVALGCALGLDWLIWLSSSGNGRYLLPMACGVGVLNTILIFRLFRARPKIRNYVLAVVFAVDALQLGMGSEYRWNGVPWDGGPWFEVSIPRPLTERPSLYLTLGIESNSFIVPFVAHGSGFVNFSGGYALGADGASGARIRALISRYAPEVRMLVRGKQLYGDHDTRWPRRLDVDEVLARADLHVDAGDCETMAIKGLPPPLEPIITSTKIVPIPKENTTYLVSCSVKSGSTVLAQQASYAPAVDLVLDRLEDACPMLFQPRRPLTELTRAGGLRRYMNTDLSAWVTHGEVKFQQSLRGDDVVYLGRESEWQKGPVRLACGRRGEHYFARIVN